MKRLFLFLPLLLLTLFSCRQSSFDDQCAEQAEEFTEKQCPKKISEGVVLDSMTYSKTLRCLSYHYTLSGKVDDAKLVQGNIGMFSRSIALHDYQFRRVETGKRRGDEFSLCL